MRASNTERAAGPMDFTCLYNSLRGNPIIDVFELRLAGIRASRKRKRGDGDGGVSAPADRNIGTGTAQSEEALCTRAHSFLMETHQRAIRGRIAALRATTTKGHRLEPLWHVVDAHDSVEATVAALRRPNVVYVRNAALMDDRLQLRVRFHAVHRRLIEAGTNADDDHAAADRGPGARTSSSRRADAPQGAACDDRSDAPAFYPLMLCRGCSRIVSATRRQPRNRPMIALLVLTSHLCPTALLRGRAVLVTADAVVGTLVRVPEDANALLHRVAECVAWRRRAARECARLTAGCCPEMYPVMTDVPPRWQREMHAAARATGELTQLWGCGVEFRQRCWRLGIRSIDDLAVWIDRVAEGAERAELNDVNEDRAWLRLRVRGDLLLQRLVRGNRRGHAAAVPSATVARSMREVTRAVALGERYGCYDFETLQHAGELWIFAAVLHVYEGEGAAVAGGGGRSPKRPVAQRTFVLRSLEDVDQAALLGEMWDWMSTQEEAAVSTTPTPSERRQRLPWFHWSAAEPQFVRRALAHCAQHLEEPAASELRRLHSVDLMRRCIDHGLVVRGAPNYKLKVLSAAIGGDSDGDGDGDHGDGDDRCEKGVLDGLEAERFARHIYVGAPRFTRRTLRALRPVLRYCSDDVRKLEQIIAFARSVGVVAQVP